MNTKELGAILTVSPTLKVWDPMVNTISPVVGLYVALVGVKLVVANVNSMTPVAAS